MSDKIELMKYGVVDIADNCSVRLDDNFITEVVFYGEKIHVPTLAGVALHDIPPKTVFRDILATHCPAVSASLIFNTPPSVNRGFKHGVMNAVSGFCKSVKSKL